MCLKCPFSATFLHSERDRINIRNTSSTREQKQEKDSNTLTTPHEFPLQTPVSTIFSSKEDDYLRKARTDHLAVSLLLLSHLRVYDSHLSRCLQ